MSKNQLHLNIFPWKSFIVQIAIQGYSSISFSFLYNILHSRLYNDISIWRTRTNCN
jgi:hypothetical protein